MDSYKGGEIVRAALKLTPLVFVRPGELRKARWEHVDFKAAKWAFPASKIQKKVAVRPIHVVPLAYPMVALKEKREAP